MRMAVISDIHGNLAALEAVLADIERRGADLTVNLGDCLSGPLDGAGTARRLMALNLPTVMGNHDQWLIDRPSSEMGTWERPVFADLTPDMLDWLRNLPMLREVEGVLLCHATPTSNTRPWLDRPEGGQMVMAPLEEVEIEAVGVHAPVTLCGHTHLPRVVRLPDGRLIVNPGSVGCPAFADRRPGVDFAFSTGAPDARYAMLERRDGAWQADLLTVAYDASDMITLAQAKGEDDWVQALTTGWVAL